MITNQDRAAVRKIYQKTLSDIAPLVDSKARKAGLPTDEIMLKIMAAQNALRACMEVILNDCIPYDESFCAELGVRLAAYTVTATPIESHAMWIGEIQRALPAAVANKIKEGAIIRTQWLKDGVERPNVPSRGDLQ